MSIEFPVLALKLLELRGKVWGAASPDGSDAVAAHGHLAQPVGRGSMVATRAAGRHA